MRIEVKKWPLTTLTVYIPSSLAVDSYLNDDGPRGFTYNYTRCHRCKHTLRRAD